MSSKLKSLFVRKQNSISLRYMTDGRIWAVQFIKLGKIEQMFCKPTCHLSF